MPVGIKNPERLEQANVKNLVYALSIDQTYKAQIHVHSLLVETFRAMDVSQDYYKLNDESKETKLVFYQHVLEDIPSRGHLVAHLRKSSPTTSTQELSERLKILDPATLLILVEVHIHGRSEFQKYADDRQTLVIKKSGTVSQKKHAGEDRENLDLDAVPEEDTEDETMVVVDGTENKDKSLSVTPDFRHHDYSKHSKLDNMLLFLVDKWIKWLGQEKGYAVDEALLRGMNLF